MLFKVGVQGAAGITAALVFLGMNVEFTPVKAVPASPQNQTAGICAKIDAETYGYCCRLRLEPSCPAAGAKAAPLGRSAAPKTKVAEARDTDDLSFENTTSVFMNGNNTDPGRGLAANNGGQDGGAANGGVANAGAEADTDNGGRNVGGETPL